MFVWCLNVMIVSRWWCGILLISVCWCGILLVDDDVTSLHVKLKELVGITLYYLRPKIILFLGLKIRPKIIVILEY